MIKYARDWEPLPGYMPQGYFLDINGQAYDFGRISQELKNIFGYPKSVHIYEQLKFLGLNDIFLNGSTPLILPFTFG